MNGSNETELCSVLLGGQGDSRLDGLRKRVTGRGITVFAGETWTFHDISTKSPPILCSNIMSRAGMSLVQTDLDQAWLVPGLLSSR